MLFNRNLRAVLLTSLDMICNRTARPSPVSKDVSAKQVSISPSRPEIAFFHRTYSLFYPFQARLLPLRPVKRTLGLFLYSFDWSLLKKNYYKNSIKFSIRIDFSIRKQNLSVNSVPRVKKSYFMAFVRP